MAISMVRGPFFTYGQDIFNDDITKWTQQPKLSMERPRTPEKDRPLPQYEQEKCNICSKHDHTQCCQHTTIQHPCEREIFPPLCCILHLLQPGRYTRFISLQGSGIEISAQIYFRTHSKKKQNSVLIFAQFRANILLKEHFCTRLFQNMKKFPRR